MLLVCSVTVFWVEQPILHEFKSTNYCGNTVINVLVWKACDSFSPRSSGKCICLIGISIKATLLQRGTFSLDFSVIVMLGKQVSQKLRFNDICESNENVSDKRREREREYTFGSNIHLWQKYTVFIDNNQITLFWQYFGPVA